MQVDNGPASVTILRHLVASQGREIVQRSNPTTGMTLLHWAAYIGCTQPRANMVRLLLDTGCSPVSFCCTDGTNQNHQDCWTTPVDIAGSVWGAGEPRGSRGESQHRTAWATRSAVRSA